MKQPAESKTFKYPRMYLCLNPREDVQGDLHIVYPDSIMLNTFVAFNWYQTHFKEWHKTDPIAGLKKFCKINKLELIYVGEIL